MKTIRKNIKWIILVCFLSMLLSISLKAIIQMNNGIMTISINYPGAEKGLNPDGTRFNMFEITSDKVLERTLSKLNLPNITVEYLRSRINIYPIVPARINDRIKAVRATGKEFTYFPNEYVLSYSQKKKFSPNHTRKLLETLFETYMEVFKENHTDRIILLSENKFDLNYYEYIEIPDIFSSKANSIIDYLTAKKYENGSFLSTKTNVSFENLIDEYKRLNEIDIAALRAFVYTSRIAKNKQELVNKLQFDIDKLNIQYSKYLKENEVSKLGMQTYDSTIVYSLFIPSIDKNSDLYMNKTKTGLDYLTERALKAGVNAETLKKEIENKNKLIKGYMGISASQAEQQRLSNTCDEMIRKIEGKFDEYARSSQDTLNDYYNYKNKSYINCRISHFGIKNIFTMGYIKTALLYGFIAFLGMSILFMLMEMRKFQSGRRRRYRIINKSNEKVMHVDNE